MAISKFSTSGGLEEVRLRERNIRFINPPFDHWRRSAASVRSIGKVAAMIDTAGSTTNII